jgi:endonuclease/exonuclease/phosphatase family metal-dependent hydrolase
LPTLLVGDFNCAPGHSAYKTLQNQFEDVWYSRTGKIQSDYVATTFHHWWGLQVNMPLARVALHFAFWVHGGTPPYIDRYHVDWVLYKPIKIRPIDALIVTDHDRIQYPSDHFPVIGLFQFK